MDSECLSANLVEVRSVKQTLRKRKVDESEIGKENLAKRNWSIKSRKRAKAWGGDEVNQMKLISNQGLRF